MLDKSIIKQLHTQFKFLEKQIKSYDRIVIYRHQSPDFDALGSQMGLYYWIKDNFPNKEVHYVGDIQSDYMPSIFPLSEKLDDSFYSQEHLAITVDISNRKRLADDHISQAKYVVKIDHHPLPSSDQCFGDYLIVYPSRPAAAEIVALFVLSRSSKYIISSRCASSLYCGIVGDTGKFTYQDTDSTTFRVAADLVDKGVDINALTFDMYAMNERSLKILKTCLNNYKITEKGTCYYLLTKEVMNELNMTVDQGNLHINVFRDIKNVKIACSITWDEAHNDYRVSLRSAKVHVAKVAVNFNGGGHDFAAGCHIKTLNELPELLRQLDELN